MKVTFYIAGIAALIFASLSGLASYRYNTLILNPQVAWSGAYLQVSSILSGGSDPRDSSVQTTENPQEIIARYTAISESLVETVDATESWSTESDKEVKALIAKGEESSEGIAKQRESLELLDKQLKDSSLELSSLSREIDAASAYEAIEISDVEEIDEITNLENTPTVQEMNDLIARQASGQTAEPNTIPEKVLQNVEQSTGIAPEEVNELLNRE